MARMMDNLILDNLAPFAFTKITTHHRARGLSGGNNVGTNANVVKKATSHNNLPQQSGGNVINGMGGTSLRINKKVPTQGKNNHFSFKFKAF
jgi:hypothetical protein